jgi:hypothetical protein
MRGLLRGRTVLYLLTVLGAGLAARAQEQQPSKPLSVRDIAQMRRERVPQKTIVQRATEQGVDFKVTPAVEKQLARLDFDDAQIKAIREASMGAELPPAGAVEKGPPIVPGEELPKSAPQREAVYERMAKIAKLSGVRLQPVTTRHLTLWTTKEDQDHLLADIKKIENYLEQKCSQPLRSGLDKRAAHLVLVERHYEYEKWVNAMYEVMPEAFKLSDAPGGQEDLKTAVLKWSGFYSRNVSVICVDGRDEQSVRRSAATDIGNMNFVQQVEPLRHDPLATGFANFIEALLFGQPSVLLFTSSYHNENRELGKDPRAWLHLVQDRIRRKQATTVRALLAMDTTNMLLPHYAEAWTLTGLLAKQPEKFGALIVALREEKDALKAIEQVYGWDETKLEAEWHKAVLAQR